MARNCDSNGNSNCADHLPRNVKSTVVGLENEAKGAIRSKSNHRCSRHSKPEFRFFRLLPAELRHMIWKFALPGGRIFELSQDERLRNIRLPGYSQNNSQFLREREVSGVPGVYITNHKTSKLRLACQEANKAFLRTGGFEFGLFGSSYRGLWFNYSQNILFLPSEPSSWTYIDLLRVTRVAILHTKLMSLASCNSYIDIITNHITSCRQLIVLQSIDWTPGSVVGSSSWNLRLPVQLYDLQDDDILGKHEFPEPLAAKTVVIWKVAKEIIKQLWYQRVTEGCVTQGRVPEVVGKEMLKASPSFFH
ncbi:hypothetical protein CTRI78_v005548 [Colletotrichum trifolii]|uniref:2EXR domain-containing protein n=1 Tax=Colletotrichum trifolii TaxID=5466 RepID=A0A4R8RLC2_COLTR|nr:hypothetical protein CTRI78_v005548 [Colletotrichum trifolii]